ncbi:MAG: DNA polymerase III subunit gamma/tau, partial [Clostridia bacterium]|nr:DNA polymerase III subunit gamma/tau [Clostridia bacterium]
MDHQALYRQFRPETFSDLVGQDAIVTALKNQIINNKTAHAYLFCGTRGTGKTTTARILSRAVNCKNPQNGEPCNECEACRNIMENTAIDVVEIDAASNTSVDNVRQIREEVVYPPMSLKKKVYIIDEVHMLSGGAFNALLKTLEEPPEYAMFILATTEYHKVPATILSRCQRFDFKRISGATITQRLKYVCNESGAEFDDDAIAAVAYAADGSMRDGLSILEKCLSFSSDKLTAESVARVLGTVDNKDLFALSTAIAEKDAATAVAVCEKTIAEG